MVVSNLDIFLWAIFPYIALTIFVLGHIYRYNTDQIGWSAKSSQLLEQRKLKPASILFHYGITFVFFGHVAGLLIPKSWYDAVGISSKLYHFGAISLGGLAGLATVIGGALFYLRRVTVKRVRKNSTTSDFVSLILLGIVVLAGFTATLAYTASGGSFDYRVTIGPWLRGILLFKPNIEYMAAAPIGFKLHVFFAFVLFAVWPFTRLVHVFSLPLKYLNRRYIIYRNVKPYDKPKVPKRNELT